MISSFSQGATPLSLLPFSPFYSAASGMAESHPIVSGSPPVRRGAPSDRLLALFEKYLDDRGWVRKDAALPQLPGVPEASIDSLKKLLKKSFTLKIEHKSESCFEIELSLNELFEVLGGKNQLVGGHVQHLLTDQWYNEAISLLNGDGCDRKLLGFSSLKFQEKGDIDFRHYCPDGRSAADQAEKIVEHIASKIFAKKTPYNFREICNFIKHKDGPFAAFNPLFELEEGKRNDGWLISFRSKELGKVDILIASHLESAELSASQDLWIDLEKPHRPQGACAQGWQAVIDTRCGLLHLKRTTPKAFTKAMTSLVKNQVSLEPFSPELLKNLRLYTVRSKKGPVQAAASLLESEIANHHAGTFGDWTALTFMASSYMLRDNLFTLSEVRALWAEIARRAPIKRDVCPFQRIMEASLRLPFDAVSAVLQIQGYLSLNRHRNNESADTEALLRWHERVPCLGMRVEGCTLTVPFDLLEAAKSVANSWRSESDDGRRLIDRQFQAFDPYLQLEDSFPVAIKEQLGCFEVHVPGLAAAAEELIGCSEEALFIAGYKLAYDSLSLGESFKAAELLLRYLPIALYKAQDKDGAVFLTRLIEERLKLYYNPNDLSQFFEGMRAALQSLPFEKNRIYEAVVSHYARSENLDLAKYGYELCAKAVKESAPEKIGKTHHQFAMRIAAKHPVFSLEILSSLLREYHLNEADLLAAMKKIFSAIRTFPAAASCFPHLAKCAALAFRHSGISKAALENFFSEQVRTLFKMDMQAAYLLLQALFKDTSLFQKSVEGNALWIQCCQGFFDLKPNNTQEALQVWKEGRSFQACQLNASCKIDRHFAISFAEALYAAGDPEADAAGHELVQYLNSVPSKSDPVEKIAPLRVIHQTKVMEENQTQERLTNQYNELIEALGSISDVQQRKYLKDITFELLQKLCSFHSNPHFYKANVALARTLLGKPKVMQLFKDQLYDLQGVLVACLKKNADRPSPERFSSPLAGSLIETALNCTFEIPLSPVSLECYKTTAAFFAKGAEGVSASLDKLIKSRFFDIAKALNGDGCYYDVCNLFLAISRRSSCRVEENNEGRVLLFSAIQAELQFHVKAFQARRKAASGTFSPTERPSQRLQVALDCLSYLAVSEDWTSCCALEFCHSYAQALLQLNQAGPALQWISLMLDSIRKNPATVTEEVLASFVEMALFLGESKQGSTCMSIFNALRQSCPSKSSALLKAMLKLPDHVVLEDPGCFLELLLGNAPETGPSDAIHSEQAAAKAKMAVLHLLKGQHSPKCADIALRLFENCSIASQLPIMPLTSRIRSINDYGLKKRVIAVLKKRINAIEELIPLKQHEPELDDWKASMLACWSMMAELAKHKNCGAYKNDLYKYFADILSDNSNLTAAIKNIFDGKTAFAAMEILVPIGFEVVDNLELHPELVSSVLKMRDALVFLETHKHIVFTIDKGLLVKLQNSNTPFSFFIAFRSFYKILKQSNKRLTKKEMEVFYQLLRHLGDFNAAEKRIFYSYLDRILDRLQKHDLFIDETINLAEVCRPYQDFLPSAKSWVEKADLLSKSGLITSEKRGLTDREKWELEFIRSLRYTSKFGKFLLLYGLCLAICHIMIPKRQPEESETITMRQLWFSLVAALALAKKFL